MARFVVGTSGWNYPHWRTRFYPRDLPSSQWLAYYARRFPTVEVNNTFYRLPDARVFTAWREAVPGSFTFALKASRFITHIRRLRLSRRPVQRLLTRARPLRRRLGPILFQLPPTFQRDDVRLAAFLAALPAGRRYVVEFRHVSWHCDPVYHLLRRHRVACCVSDGPGIPLRLVKTARFVYARFHGPAGIGAGRYHDAALRSWSRRLRELSGRDIAYVYFNNDQEGHAVANATRLAELLERP
ncbi:MAG TPA: DUF72 domain-containing protein [bacterium]|nr:DUF72 domain-containing protein [bacterium]